MRYLKITRDGITPATFDADRPTLEQMQAEVQGSIELIASTPGGEPGRSIDLWGNDEARLLGMAPTLYSLKRDEIIVGPCIVCASDAEGDTVGLTDEEVARVQIVDLGLRLVRTLTDGAEEQTVIPVLFQ